MKFPIIARLTLAALRAAGIGHYRPGHDEHSAGHLRNLDGSLYMGRWWIVPPNTARSRFLQAISRGRYETIRLHHINRGDEDRELHSHPFDYSTFILKGWYVEQKLDDKSYVPGLPHTINTDIRMMDTGSIGQMVSSFHRIANVSDGGVWTMFWMGPNHGKWGFLMPDARYLDRKAYFRLRGYGKAAKADKPKDFQP